MYSTFISQTAILPNMIRKAERIYSTGIRRSLAPFKVLMHELLAALNVCNCFYKGLRAKFVSGILALLKCRPTRDTLDNLSLSSHTLGELMAKHSIMTLIPSSKH